MTSCNLLDIFLPFVYDKWHLYEHSYKIQGMPKVKAYITNKSYTDIVIT